MTNSNDEIPKTSTTSSEVPGDKLREHIASLIPGVVQDGVINAELLGELLNAPVAGLKDGKPQFGLMWAGRKLAAEALHTPSFAALSPQNADSDEWANAENVFIVGDNLEVLKLMQTAYNDQVKLIYIDPPYNTGNDFVYNDDFSDPVRHYLEVTGQVDPEGNRLVANTETTGRKHSNWLTMMYPRLVLARNMLTEDGLIAISIDNNEITNLISILDAIFGEENQVGIISVVNNPGGRSDSSDIATSHEYLVLYSRGAFVGKGLPLTESILDTYKQIDEATGRRYRFSALRKSGTNSLRADRPNLYYPLFVDPATMNVEAANFPEAIEVFPTFPDGREGCWRWGLSTAQSRISELIGRRSKDRYEIYVKDYLEGEDESQRRTKPKSVWSEPKFASTMGTKRVKELFGYAAFDYPKPVDLIKELLIIATDEDDLIVDFFAGSGTTGDAIFNLNNEDGGRRRFVLVQLGELVDPESVAGQAGYKTVADITRERLRLARVDVTGSSNSAIREFSLSNSAFRRKEVEDPDALFTLDPRTLDDQWTPAKVTAEIALALGARLDEEWVTLPLTHGDATRIGNIVVVTSIEITDDLIDELVDIDANVIAFLEDGFADNDSVKANGFSKLKNAKKTVRYY